MVENKFPGKDVSEDDLETKLKLVAKKSEDHTSLVNVSGVVFGGSSIPIMAGPNTVEDQSMIIDIAHSIKESGAHILRGGAYKPLSFPYRGPKFFELREVGLEYLAKAGQEAGIPIVTEVMHSEKMKFIAEHSDMLQIGSRNMQNYPLLEAAAETGKPILLKRHYGASLRDWLGAAEYIMYGGNENIVLCERGVSTAHTHRMTSRFLLDLQVVPAAKELTHLPIATDPSHATFWRDWVNPMAKASIASGADSIMLEVHPDPTNAAVDPLQPIDFKTFEKLMLEMDLVAKSIGRKILD